MRKKIAILGAKGKMGRSLIESFIKCSQFEIAFALIRKDDPSVAENVGKVLDLNLDLLVFSSNIATALANSDILIDFTIRSSTLMFEILELNKKYQKIIIIGTTGYNQKEKEQIAAYGKYFPMLMAANFSIAMNVFFYSLAKVAKILNSHLDYDVEILESHHRFKKDLPSGTAIELNNIIKKSDSGYSEKIIHALREGNIIGIHEVRFTDLYESFKMTHHVYDRKTFSKGVVLACQWLLNQKIGFYSMQDVFNFKVDY